MYLCFCQPGPEKKKVDGFKPSYLYMKISLTVEWKNLRNTEAQ